MIQNCFTNHKSGTRKNYVSTAVLMSLILFTRCTLIFRCVLILGVTTMDGERDTCLFVRPGGESVICRCCYIRAQRSREKNILCFLGCRSPNSTYLAALRSWAESGDHLVALRSQAEAVADLAALGQRQGVGDYLVVLRSQSKTCADKVGFRSRAEVGDDLAALG